MFASNLRRLRREAGLTLQALGDRAGMHRESVAQLERGRRRPTWASALALADALGVSLDLFRDRPEDRKADAGRRGKTKQSEGKERAK
jgi:transcriptional regulator with XRE-family HTH domain